MRPKRQVSEGTNGTILSTFKNVAELGVGVPEAILSFTCTSHSLLVRACRNAIEFNQIPSLGEIVPGGRDEMKLDVLLAVPPAYQDDLDLRQVRSCFPYGQIRIQVQDGGMVAQSGVAIPELGDKNQDMVVVCTAVTVGY